MYDIMNLSKTIAKISLSIHCGCALYRQFVTYPMILNIKDPTERVKCFKSVFYSTQKIQIPTKLISLGCCCLTYYLEKIDKKFFLAGITIALITPYSHGLMSPLSNAILDESFENRSKMPLLKKWIKLHIGRLTMALTASLLMNI